MKAVAIILLCVIPFISAKAADPPSSKCIVDYLKNQGFLGAKNEQPKELTPECVTLVDNAKNAIIKKYRKKFTKDETYSETADCLIKKLKKKDFFDRELIKSLDFSKAKVPRKKIESSDMLGAVTNTMHLQKAFTSCEVESNFDDVFKYDTRVSYNELFEKESSGEEDNNVDYCVRKHMLDNNLISFNRESFNPNPRHVNPASLDCDTIYKGYVTAFEESLNTNYIDEEIEDDKKFRTCFAGKLKKHNAVETMLQFDYVKEFGLNDEQKTKLGDQFVDIIVKVSRGAMNCNVKIRTEG